MPVKSYFGGHGTKVMRDMKNRYGERLGTKYFYATANKYKQNPEDPKRTSAFGKAVKRKHSHRMGYKGRYR